MFFRCLELILHPQNAPDEDTYSRDEVEVSEENLAGSG